MGEEIILIDAPLEQKPRLMQNGAASFGQSGAHKYFLAGLWQLHLYHDEGEIRLTNPEWFGDKTLVYPIRPGAVSFLPPDTHSEYHLSRPGSFYYAHLALNGSCGGAGAPVMQYLDHDRGEMETLFEEAIGLSATREWRAEMKIWEFVCRLSERAVSNGPEAVGGHPAVARARQFVALRLDQPIGVAEIARAAGVSHCHLNRLFHVELGMPVKSYLTQQRMSRARYLLTYSSQSIKSIGADVGIPDPHLFNKVVRRYLGAPPTLVRGNKKAASPSDR